MDRRTFVNALALSAGTPALPQAWLDNDARYVPLRTIEERKTDDPDIAHRTVHVIAIGRNGGRLLHHPATAFEGNLTLTQAGGWSTYRTFRFLTGKADQVRIGSTVAGAQIVFLLVNVTEPNAAYVASILAEAARSTGALTVGLPIPTTPDDSDSYAAEDGMSLLASAADTVIARPCCPNFEASPQRAGALSESEVWGTIRGLSQMLLKPPFDRLACMNIREVLKQRGRVYMGIGYGIGKQRAMIAATKAIANLGITLTHSHVDAVLVIVTGPLDMTPTEAHIATRHIGSCVRVQPTIIPSWQHDLHSNGHVRVAVIAGAARRRV
jgi:cell division protein FtsZ